MLRILTCLALFACLAAGEADNEWTRLPQTPDANLDFAAKDSGNALSTLALAIWAESATTVNAGDIGKLMAYCRRGQGYASRAGIVLACSPQRSALIASLGASREGQPLAGLALAAWALMGQVDDARLAETRNKPDGPRGRSAGSADQAIWGCGGLRKGKNKPVQGGGKLTDHAKLIADLIAARDAASRSCGLIAAAYGGVQDPGVTAALEKAADKSGMAAAALVLHQARTGAAEDQALIAKAVAEKREQPPVVEWDNPYLSLDPIATPGLSMVCEAIAIRGNGDRVPLLHNALQTSKDLRVRYDAARAIRRLAQPDSVVPLIAVLGKLDRRQWPLLVQVCAALADIPDARAVEPLIAALAVHEKPDDRFRQDIIYALRSITAPQMEMLASDRAEAWKTWWTGKKDGFTVDAAASADFRAKNRVQDMQVRSLGDFYGLPLYSDRFSLVVDYSNSMKGDPITELKQRASMLIDSLPEHVQFNIVAFNSRLTWLDDYSLSSERKKANDFIANTPLALHTRSYDATEGSFSLNELDTAFLLTDGQPTTGIVVDWSAINPLSNLLLRYRPIAICTIDLKGKAKAKRIGNPLDVYANEHAGLYLPYEN